MSIKTNELQKLVSIQGVDSILADSAAGTGRVPFSAAAQFFGQELVKPENAVGAALSHKASTDFANLPSPQMALYNLGARPGENMLHNARWDCTDAIINQRKKMEYTEAGYTIDRWRLGEGATASISQNGLTVSTNTEYSGLSEILDIPYRALANKVMTISALTSDNRCFYATGIIPGEKPSMNTLLINYLDESFGRIQLRYNNNFAFHIFPLTGKSAEFLAAKLEPGPVQTLAHKEGDTWVLNDPPPDPALELAKCQRYARRITLRAAVVENIPMYGWPENKGRLCVNLSPPMRITPTLVYFGGRGYKSKTSVEFTTEIAILYDSPSTDQVVLLISDPEILAVNAQLLLSSDL